MFRELKILIKDLSYLKALRKMLAQLGLCSLKKCILQRKIRWNDEFKGQMFFSHRTTCDVAYRILWNDVKSDKNDRLLLDMKIDDQNFVLLNIYNANIKKEWLITLTELKNMLNRVNNMHVLSK